jgi:hypothetical protein
MFMVHGLYIFKFNFTFILSSYREELCIRVLSLYSRRGADKSLPFHVHKYVEFGGGICRVNKFFSIP